jgi:hypothetical protein
MGLLIKGVRDTTLMLNSFHELLRKHRAVTVETYSQALRALRNLRTALNGDAMRRASAERDRVEEAYADLTPDERQPAPLWLKAIAVAAFAGMLAVDAAFFQQIFLNILQISTENDSKLKQDIGLVAAAIMAIGLVAAGRILAGLVWRMRRRWRRPGEPPPHPAIRVARVAAVCAAPAATFYVLGWWATYRGLAAAQETPMTPPPTGVLLLLLSLALTVVVLEILVYNPYRAQLKHAERGLKRARRSITASFDAAERALQAHETAWSDLRSARDEVIALTYTELGRPLQETILPARLRHGRAGPKSIEADYGVQIEIVPAVHNDDGTIRRLETIQISYQHFAGMAQPQPAPGPLAEVIRAEFARDPEVLRKELSRLEQQLDAYLGEA